MHVVFFMLWFIFKANVSRVAAAFLRQLLYFRLHVPITSYWYNIIDTDQNRFKLLKNMSNHLVRNRDLSVSIYGSQFVFLFLI